MTLPVYAPHDHLIEVPNMPTENWRSMRESTAEDWHKIEASEPDWIQKVTIPRVLEQLKALDEGESPFPVSCYEHKYPYANSDPMYAAHTSISI